MDNFDKQAAELVNYIDLLTERFLLVQTLSSQEMDNLSKQELKVLRFVGRNSPCIMRDITSYMHLVSSAITAIVDKLVHKKLLRRFRPENDRRMVKVELTDAGWEVYHLEMEHYLQLSRSMLALLSPAEQAHLLMLLRKISLQLDTLAD